MSTYDALLAGAAAALERIERERRGPVERPATEEAARSLAGALTLDGPIPLDEALDRAVELMTRHGVQTASRRHFGWFNPTPIPESALADLLVSAANPQLAVWAQSPLAVEAERALLARLAGCFGLPAEAGGAFTTGGSEASTTAVVAALTRAFPAYAERGLFGLERRPVFYASREAHHSLEKIAHACGLGRGALRFVDTDAELRMDLAALDRAIAADRAAGLHPFMVVGTAGTTRAGSVDPLGPLADRCAAEGLFFHVDGAFGGAFAT